MEIYLIRHTTPDIEKGICYGQSDIPLKNSFLKEAEKVLRAIPNSFDKVYSSPLQRCTQLANLISQDITRDKRLMELDFGSWELKEWSDIPNNEIQPWYDDWVNKPAYKGESYQEQQSRAVEFIEEIPNYYSKIAIVTHSGVIRSLWAHFNNIELKKSFNSLTIEYGAVLKVVYNA
ncbi:alpha-ribazole phosphatase [Algibacter sp. L4_22]|uniref:alpha-ribazole phosphatase n=1 Tax=Algibacter sp. L4_22 TaxID=2942477 RepID=UPI00201B9550|nr:alpha-ribazole phosphatase [Algibacter sp. L4_22]MCL5129226.1 alpha-ribazole phosphatase [Algibacter sp. L4_22]